MLGPEVAKERLQAWEIKADEDRFLAEIKALPAPLRAVAYGLVGRDAKGQGWERPRNRRGGRSPIYESVRPIAVMSEKDRMRIYSLFFCKMAPWIEQARRAYALLPYQPFFTHKPFRAPNCVEMRLDSFIDWMEYAINIFRRYDPKVVTPPWLAAWAPHLEHGYSGSDQDCIGHLLATVIDAGGAQGDEVFEILRQSLCNEHEIGGMGNHVIRSLLTSSRQEGWELIEKTMLAAQRQEGLRQSILNLTAEAHPEAFRRMLRLIREHDLGRFSAVVQAANGWFGLAWDSISVGVVNKTLDRALAMLDDAGLRAKALAGSDPEDIYLALWAIACEDAMESIPAAERLLKHKKAEVRFVVVYHLCRLDLPQAKAVRAKAFDDDDLRVALHAAEGTGLYSEVVEEERSTAPPDGSNDYFERLERLLQRLPAKPTPLKPLVWPWTARKASREGIAWQLVNALGKRPPTVLIPYLPAIKSHHRRFVVEMLSEQKKWDLVTRETLVRLAGDTISDVRAEACKSLAKVTLSAEEILVLEGFLTRKADDLRQGIIALLLKQADAAALASADRLTASKDAQQRLAGLEVLRQLTEATRGRAACCERATAYRAVRKKLSKDEETQLDALTGADAEQISLDNALGLMDPAQRSPAIAPKARKVQFFTSAALACIKSLDELIDKHRETTIEYKSYSGMQKELLGSVSWGFPSPSWNVAAEKSTKTLPRADLWEEWYAGRPKSLRDKDGLELLRAERWLEITDDDWDWQRFHAWGKRSAERKQVLATITCGQQRQKLKYPRLVREIIEWMSYLHPASGAVDFLLDAAETAAALVAEAEVRKLTATRKENRDFFDDDGEADWRNSDVLSLWVGELTSPRHCRTLTPEQAVRRWRLARWLDEPIPEAKRYRPNFSVLMAAYGHGAVTLADILDHLLGPDGAERYGGRSYGSLSSLTERKPNKEHQAFLSQYPEVGETVERCRARIVEIELARGELPTAATAAAWNLGTLWGTDLLVRLLGALGGKGLKVPAGWRDTGKETKVCTLTRLASVTYPRADEYPDDFSRLVTQAVAAGKITERQILELAFAAPQWAKGIEVYLGWNGFIEALYWFLAHMRYTTDASNQAAAGAGVEDLSDDSSDSDDDDDDFDTDRRKPSAWERLIAERTPISAADRSAGAVDVAWFHSIYERVTPKRWEAMAEVARLAANAAQARHARFVAEVLTGKAKRKQLIDGVRQKQLKDHVRLLGLYPLAAGAKRQGDLLERYRVLQEYRRYAAGLSSMTKPEALRSLDVGMKNLAATAGYPDPMRLEWALEAEQIQALAKSPLSATKGGVTVTLSLDAEARPQMAIERDGKPLKTIPPAVKKDKRIAEIGEQAAHLKRQAARMKASLEAAMCRGDTFSAAELVQLSSHAILAPLLERLVLVGDGVLGYPDKGGKVLRDAHGKLEPIKKGEQLRIAHAHDLFASKTWDAYQRECFQGERVQPFKQLFRELYVVTKQEKQDGAVSRRYAQQQIQPRQAFALWGQRGWGTSDGVCKTYHDAALTVSVDFMYGGGTPLEVEGLTIDTVQFHRRGEYKPLKLVDVPPRIFSEAMRDVDLVVSVAHRGGVDPEASASTVEMRAKLLRETCALLGLKNVRIKENHALIKGHLGDYSVHLGSAVVHRMPGGAVCIVAVPAEHRGRLFLPFADDDPRTAEVISKTILLARDKEIQDPSILDQLRA